MENALIHERGEDPEKALEKGRFSKLLNWLINIHPEPSKAEFKLPLISKLVFELKENTALKNKIRRLADSHLSGFFSQVNEACSEFKKEAHKLGKGGVVVIFDSLEKLRGLSQNWKEVLESAEIVFGGQGQHIKLPIYTLYTVPPALYNRITGIEFIPMIKVRNQDHTTNDIELEASRQLVAKRLPEDFLKQLFGADFRKRIGSLILFSGGYPRNILQMLRWAMLQDRLPITGQGFKQVLAQLKNQMRAVVPGEAYSWLAEVAQAQDIITHDDSQRIIADRKLSNNAVLSYLNDIFWFDLHPAVDEIPGVKKAKKALETSERIEQEIQK